MKDEKKDTKKRIKRAASMKRVVQVKQISKKKQDDGSLGWSGYEEIEKYRSRPEFITKQQAAISMVKEWTEEIAREYSREYNREIIDSINWRIKSAKSIEKKLIRKGYEVTWENATTKLNDLVGIRITCSFQDDVYRIAGRLSRDKHFILIKTKDYIRKPKSSGYQSIHLIVDVPVYMMNAAWQNQKRQEEESQSQKEEIKSGSVNQIEGREPQKETMEAWDKMEYVAEELVRVEIQIRTVAMNFWAKLDHQLCYKKDAKDADKIRKELKEYAEEIAKIDKKMLKLRQKIDEI